MRRRFGSQNGLRVLDEGRQVVHGLLPEYVFGPVDSRRYGKSLGVNPFPLGEKICSFNCPYCECGWTNKHWVGKHNEILWPSLVTLLDEIESRLKKAREQGEQIDAITFAGNGEPTLYPEFGELIEGTLALRKKWVPAARVIVLTNASELHRTDIREALLKVDETCMKLDAVSPEVVRAINKPHSSLSMDSLISLMQAFPSPVIQTMFVHGPSDNTGEKEIALWIAALIRIHPVRVDLYSIDRAAPDPRVSRVPAETLQAIADRVRREVGVPVFVY
ncbi:MAG: radical SAM protein [Candidatus Omnitrophica bacterium]|nr:radical SAM protein [bacterium]MBK7497223.1 radical SAM protein [Candidatus Omnitrophota bacterium]MCE7909905.1 radical SAM protein [Candidatus Omnitrophica bacterium COP1]MBV6483547.1 hypothetical protein [bacterium]MBW7940216.1 radical SAM protein [Candidatus Omnitrophota bacterium]